MTAKLYLGMALLAVPMLLAAEDDSTVKKDKSWPRVHLGGIMVNAGYSHLSGPGFYRYPYSYYPEFWGAGPYSYYDPFFGPYLHPGFYTGFGYQPLLGQLKVQTADKNAWVYLDGALAGRADKLKTIWLEPGAYQLEVRSGDKKLDHKVYVLSGKTFKVTPNMMEAR